MDLAILLWIQQTFACPFMDAAMPLITTCGTHGYLWVTVGIVLLFPRKTRRFGITLLVTMGLIWLLCEFGLKPAVARPRPFIVYDFQLIISPPSGYSFPSGHTLTAFCAATVLAFAPIPKGCKIGAWAMAILIAFSRLYLFVHFPSDVAAGIVIGVLAGLIGVWVSKHLAARWQAHHETGDSPNDKVSVE